MTNKPLSQTIIDRAQPKEKRYWLWDGASPNLAVEVHPSGKKTYIYRYGKTRYAMDDVRNIKLFDAREKVLRLNKIADETGKNPLKLDDGITFYAVAIEYLEYRQDPSVREGVLGIKTLKGWICAVNQMLKNTDLGNIPVKNLTTADGNKFMYEHRFTKTHTNRCRGLFKLIVDYAISKGYRATESNIWLYVKKFQETPELVRFAKGELELFIDYMQKAERGEIKALNGKEISSSWIHSVWLLFYVGCRPSEILSIKWDDIDLDKRRITLKDHKTAKRKGEKILYLNQSAVDVINRIERDWLCPYVFPGKTRLTHLRSLRKQWVNMQKATGIKATPYSLRRNFAEQGQKVEGGTEILSRILGHATKEMTEHYAGKDEQLLERERALLASHNEQIGDALSRYTRPKLRVVK